MNKYKKIALSVVSIVMAGTMVGSLAACGGGNNGGGNGGNGNVVELDENHVGVTVGGLTLSVLKDNQKKVGYPAGTEIVSNIIDSANDDRAISYHSSQIAGSWQGLDGRTYYAGDLKPAWRQLGEDLNVSFKDQAQTGRSGAELSTVAANGEWANFNLINSTVGAISENVAELVDLSQFMDYMPNFKNFLQEYKIVEWSLKMDSKGGMYYIPYFDGNDDIEKYEMVQRDWVKVILDGELPTDTSVSYLDQYKAKVEGASAATTVAPAVEAFMGKTGSWKVATTNKAGTGVGELVVSYDDVKAALANTNSDLYKAITAISGVSAPQTESGNIIDIQNDIITKTNGAVNGPELANVLRAYIKTAYKLDGAAYETLSDVFVSASAGWDADLMIALYRCVVTNFKSFNGMSNAVAGEVWALAGREMKAQRENDLISLAGELYGVRGMESRLDYLYVDNAGDLQDARLSIDSYEAAAKLNALAKEGLLFNTVGAKSTAMNKKYKSGSNVTFMLHDYVQTQTSDGFNKAGGQRTMEEFNFAPIVTPISKWDVNGDGTAETVMRFTESWRSVKNSGVVVPKRSVSDPFKLSAVIAFIDYLFSNDGQIIGSYGPMATNGNGADTNGFWYGNNGVEVLNADGTVKDAYKDKVTTVDGTQYFLKKENRSEGFMYKNTLYQGMAYKDKQIPIMTDNNKNFFLGAEVNGNKMSKDNTTNIKQDYIGNYTNYARGIVGAALPIGNKDQGFEYQCTANCGLDGASIVNVAIQNGTIKHLTQNIDENAWWYTVVPTVFPTSATEATIIAKQTELDGTKSDVGIYNPTSTAGFSNVYIDLAFWGYSDQGYGIGTNHSADSKTYPMQKDAETLLNYIKNEVGANVNKSSLVRRVEIYQKAWKTLKAMNK